MQLKYRIPFKAEQGVSAEFALQQKLINIEGIAIDTSVNQNKWQVPPEDLDFFVESLQGAQVRLDHSESALNVIGLVRKASRRGQQVFFGAEVGELSVIEKILRSYITHVSAQVDSNDVTCSKCLKPTRKEGILIHLCPGAWEIVHKPKVRELSIVASPAYEDTTFAPVGFAAAMNASQSSYTCPGRRWNSKQELLMAVSKLRETVENLKVLDREAEQAELDVMVASVDRMLRMTKPQPKTRPKDWTDDMVKSAGMKRMTPYHEVAYKEPKEIIFSNPKKMREAGLALIRREDKARKRLSLGGVDYVDYS